MAALARALAARGLAATAVDILDVDTRDRGDGAFDLVRDTVADLELRLYSLSTRHRSLDDIFLQKAYR